jgi:hypothetical protein
VLLIGVGAAFYMLITLVGAKEGIGPLPLLAIGGVIVLILMLTVVAMVFSILDLTNKQQALGLPEGSIRAVIALSLIVLFAILSVFLYQGVSRGPINTIERLTETERSQFIQNHPTARDIQSVAIKDKDGNPVKNAKGEDLFNVSYGGAPNTTADDFAKQLLVLLGTLMTAVTSFYLGAGTATTAAQVGQTAGQVAASATVAPSVSGIKPTSIAISDGPMAKLEIMGANLNGVTHAKITQPGVQPVIATNVKSSPTGVTCEIPVSMATSPPGLWDVVVDDGGAKSATLPGALTITA